MKIGDHWEHYADILPKTTNEEMIEICGRMIKQRKKDIDS